jgi:hypothetical protein
MFLKADLLYVQFMLESSYVDVDVDIDVDVVVDIVVVVVVVVWALIRHSLPSVPC